MTDKCSVSIEYKIQITSIDMFFSFDITKKVQLEQTLIENAKCSINAAMHPDR